MEAYQRVCLTPAEHEVEQKLIARPAQSQAVFSPLAYRPDEFISLDQRAGSLDVLAALAA